jgi:uncharacterized C2H2 Zn-finger protein
MFKVQFAWPINDLVRLSDTEYDIECPKCNKLAFTHRDDSDGPTSFKCPNCSSAVLLTKDYFRFHRHNGDYAGCIDAVFLSCGKGCGWATNFKKGDRLKHDECGAEIGQNFISSPAIEDYDIDGNDPDGKFLKKLLRIFHW